MTGSGDGLDSTIGRTGAGHVTFALLGRLTINVLKGLALVPAILLTATACSSGASTTTAPQSTTRSTVSARPGPSGAGTLALFYSLAGHESYQLALARAVRPTA